MIYTLTRKIQIYYDNELKQLRGELTPASVQCSGVVYLIGQGGQASVNAYPDTKVFAIDFSTIQEVADYVGPMSYAEAEKSFQ